MKQTGMPVGKRRKLTRYSKANTEMTYAVMPS